MRTYKEDATDEDHARLILLGLDALPFSERWMLCWLLDQSERMSIAFAEISGLPDEAFWSMIRRWRALGLLTTAYNETHDANLPQATDYAAMIAGLIPATDGLYFGGPLVDLDAVELAG
ncbi:hypothetical protein ACIBEH_22080 [Nocardia salmonicida]|uniref:hypothetical protein n=1 Tax=Nocardia salmonicida TaxID=53431 RepID=UPI0037BC9E43